MTRAPQRSYRTTAIVVLVAAVIVGSGIDLAISRAWPASPSVLGSIETGDLQLNVSTNSSLLSSGHSLGITVSVKSIAAQPLNISAQGNWTIPGFPIAVFGGCIGAEPIEFFIVRGNLSLSGLRQESVNSLGFPIFCAEDGDVNFYLFNPDSSLANTTGIFCLANCNPNTGSVNLTSSFSVKGYWGYPINSSETNDVLTPRVPNVTALQAAA